MATEKKLGAEAPEQKKGKKKSGPKPLYSDPAEMQAKIDAYFEACKGHLLADDHGGLVLDKFGRPIVVDQRQPTVTRLAYELGLSSRQALLNYQGKKEFEAIILRAKLYIEACTEERLFDRDGVAGAKFSLMNNFKGWSETPQDGSGTNGASVNIIFDIPRPAAVFVPAQEAEQAAPAESVNDGSGQ